MFYIIMKIKKSVVSKSLINIVFLGSIAISLLSLVWIAISGLFFSTLGGNSLIQGIFSVYYIIFSRSLGPEASLLESMLCLGSFLVFIIFCYYLLNSSQKLYGKTYCLGFAMSLFFSLPIVFWLTSIIISLIISPFLTAHDKSSMTLLNFKESLINLPGISDPVGIKIDFDMEFRSGKERSFNEMYIWMSPEEANAKKVNRTLNQGASLTQNRPWQNKKKNRPDQMKFLRLMSMGNYKTPDDNMFFQSGIRQHFSLNLLPIQINRFIKWSNEISALCVNLNPPNLLTNIGNELNASWSTSTMYGSFINVDLSKELTKALRNHSALQKNYDLWNRIQSSVSIEKMEKSDWGACPKKLRVTNNEKCFCTEYK